MGDSGDFIFARRPDGVLEFKGDFEGLYQSDPDPWGQSGGDPRMKEYYEFSRMELAAAPPLVLLKNGLVLEAGCGIGYVTSFLATMAALDVAVEGMDISPSAIKSAKAHHPCIRFWVEDVGASIVDRGFFARYNIVILNQMLWYVLDRLPNVFRNVDRMLKPQGHLIVQNAFLDNQEYGREVVDGFNGLLKYVLDHHVKDFQVVSASYDASPRFAPYHDGLLVLQSTR